MNGTLRMKSLTTPDLVFGLKQRLGQDLGLHWKDFQTLSTRFRNEGMPFFAKTLPKLAKALLAGLGTGQFLLPSEFKRSSRRSALPAFLAQLFKKVFLLDGTLRPDACPFAVASIRQICEFTYKAELPRKPSEDQAVVDRFVDVECELAQLRISDDPILKMGNLLASMLFWDYSDDELHCKHGPGVTANVKIVDKFDHKLSAGMPSVSYYSSYFFFNGSDGMDRLNRYPVWRHENYFVSTSVAKVILVDKDSRGPRLISCEPAENQWIQQGIARYMVDKMGSNPITAGHVNFLDQSVNRNLALKHSVTREYSTLDLKDASDRVSLQLVARLFDGLSIHRALLNVRSEYTILPDKRKVRLSKHAPMGSALCFPVMAISIYLILVSGLIGIGLTLEQAIEAVYVYGDDVVIKTEHAKYAMDLLERYGLRINKEKSFINSPFLESCGLDAYNGNVVTPIRLRDCDISCTNNVLTQKPSILVSLTETANLLAESGYTRTAEYLYQYCESWLGPLPYGHQESPYLNRWAFNSLQESIPEANYLLKGIRWRSVEKRFPTLPVEQAVQRYPLGSMMRAWAIKPRVTTHKNATVWGHLNRVWGMIGRSEEAPLPLFGEYTLPRDYDLIPSWFDHYSM